MDISWRLADIMAIVLFIKSNKTDNGQLLIKKKEIRRSTQFHGLLQNVSTNFFIMLFSQHFSKIPLFSSRTHTCRGMRKPAHPHHPKDFQRLGNL